VQAAITSPMIRLCSLVVRIAIPESKSPRFSF
jgi:hypothetical protein